MPIDEGIREVGAWLSNGIIPIAQPQRRLLDVSAGGILLLLSLPLILLAVLAIRLETKGNPFFLQRRIGLGGKAFTIVKLRGMNIDARVRFAELYGYSRHGGLHFHFHSRRDPRVTGVGAFVRRTSIDELPNFLNVVLGQMTLVGPRPEVSKMLDLYGTYKVAYLSIKPGVTCISKISGRDSLSKQESIEMDLGYLNTMSTQADLSILWKTLQGVLLRKNVYDGKSTVESPQHESHSLLHPSAGQEQTEAGIS
jgi:lipopolysaccharide/colanic/teichoic acid biosynthesis glycosyltransferase